MNFRCYPVVIGQGRSGGCRPCGSLNPRGLEPRPYIIPYNLTGLTRVRTKLRRFWREYYTEARRRAARKTRLTPDTSLPVIALSPFPSAPAFSTCPPRPSIYSSLILAASWQRTRRSGNAGRNSRTLGRGRLRKGRPSGFKYSDRGAGCGGNRNGGRGRRSVGRVDYALVARLHGVLPIMPS